MSKINNVFFKKNYINATTKLIEDSFLRYSLILFFCLFHDDDDEYMWKVEKTMRSFCK